mmetsp:Transcript_30054/g.33743  ORF Transcript_30054/g.33743 Transcript_30054/m.33743 type:complete len:199 (+) Transcript_30054:86-682(+)
MHAYSTVSNTLSPYLTSTVHKYSHLIIVKTFLIFPTCHFLSPFSSFSSLQRLLDLEAELAFELDLELDLFSDFDFSPDIDFVDPSDFDFFKRRLPSDFDVEGDFFSDLDLSDLSDLSVLSDLPVLSDFSESDLLSDDFIKRRWVSMPLVAIISLSLFPRRTKPRTFDASTILDTTPRRPTTRTRNKVLRMVVDFIIFK